MPNRTIVPTQVPPTSQSFEQRDGDQQEEEEEELFMTTFKHLEMEHTKVKRSKHFIFLSINPGGILPPSHPIPSHRLLSQTMRNLRLE